jgi:hypothetical protein
MTYTNDRLPPFCSEKRGYVGWLLPCQLPCHLERADWDPAQTVGGFFDIVRSISGTTTYSQSVPRGRGDYPVNPQNRSGHLTCSPRTRGLSGPKMHH